MRAVRTNEVRALQRILQQDMVLAPGDGQFADEAVGRSANAKISWRLLPLIFVSYLIAYMDRINVSFASVPMNSDLGFSVLVYGLGAGLFFAGYALFQVPSNLLLARFGARVWIAAIMLTWGAISIGMMFVHTPLQFYTVRFLLGVAEAGFFPGVMLYLSGWFPNAWRGRAISRFYIAAPVGTILMGMLAGALLGLDGWLGLKGWQWLFLVEGLPAVFMAILLLTYLPDALDTASWLSSDEKSWVKHALATDVAVSGGVDYSFLRALLNPLSLTIGLVVALSFACLSAMIFSGPKLLIEATGWSMTKVGFLISLGGLATTAAMLAIGWTSDKSRDRYWHLTGAIGLSALVAATMALATSPLVTVLGFLAFNVVVPIIAMLGLLVASDNMHPSLRIVGFAALNTIAQTGNAVGPALWGLAAARTGDFDLGLAVIPFVLIAALGIVLATRWISVRPLAAH